MVKLKIIAITMNKGYGYIVRIITLIKNMAMIYVMVIILAIINIIITIIMLNIDWTRLNQPELSQSWPVPSLLLYYLQKNGQNRSRSCRA